MKRTFGIDGIPEHIDELIYLLAMQQLRGLFPEAQLTESQAAILEKWIEDKMKEKKGYLNIFFERLRYWKEELIKDRMEQAEQITELK